MNVLVVIAAGLIAAWVGVGWFFVFTVWHTRPSAQRARQARVQAALDSIHVCDSASR